jgi:hypothetical protein
MAEVNGDNKNNWIELQREIQKGVIPKHRYSYEKFQKDEEERSEVWRLKNIVKRAIIKAGQNPRRVMNVRPV